MFIGREKELATLEKLYASENFAMPVIYGRRRVGKTRLIREFLQDKRCIYFQARRTNAKANLDLFSLAISAGITNEQLGSLGTYDSFDAAFNALAMLSKKERLVVVIDEFPYLAQSEPSISSLLQEKIDHVFKEQSNLMLILCGSSLSFMEEQVLGYQSPLYGRRTAQMKILPLSFFDMLNGLQGVKPNNAAVLYGITNGIPAYMEMLNLKLSVSENIQNLYLKTDGYLYEEPGNLLLQECRSPEQYDAIIQAIARGRSRLAEIATTAHVPESNTRMYLKRLENIGIVKREWPFGDSASKKVIYTLCDSMFRFWYKFVPQNIGLIENDMSEIALERVEQGIPEFMGQTFESICAQWIIKQAKVGEFPVLPASMGRWWGSDPRTKSQEEIDIVVSDNTSEKANSQANSLALCECKWRNEPCDAHVVKKLISRSELFVAKKKYLYVFSKAGFTSGCIEFANQQGNVVLVSFEDMCS